MTQGKPRFRVRVGAYHHGRWQWQYVVIDTRPITGAPRSVAGRAQFASQAEALRIGCRTLERMGLNGVR